MALDKLNQAHISRLKAMREFGHTGPWIDNLVIAQTVVEEEAARADHVRITDKEALFWAKTTRQDVSHTLANTATIFGALGSIKLMLATSIMLQVAILLSLQDFAKLQTWLQGLF